MTDPRLPQLEMALDPDAMIRVLEREYEVVNLGESRCVTLAFLIRQLENAIGKRALIDRKPAQPGDMPLTHADIGKARRLFGYAPSTPIETGISRFVEWLLITAREPMVDSVLQRTA